MNTNKSIAVESSPWRVAAVAKEARVRPGRQALDVLRRAKLFARIGAAFSPAGLRHLDLDFHPQRYSPLGIGFLAAGLLLAAAALADYGSASDEVQHWQSELARLQQTPLGLQASKRPGDEAAAQQAEQAAAAVNQDIKRPWEALFTTIEAAKSDDVALLGINPDATRGVVRINGEARKREAILAYMDRLGQGKVLSNVVLIEDQLQQQDPEKPFRFTLSADWRQGT